MFLILTLKEWNVYKLINLYLFVVYLTLPR